MTLTELEKNYTEHHTSYARGYVSVKASPIIESYKGKFGEGYRVLKHNPNSTQYMIVTYFIRK